MYSNLSVLESQINHQKHRWLSGADTISITKLLNSEQFQLVIHESRNYRVRIFTPMVTLLLFIKQVLGSDKSCKKAVSNFVAEQSKQGFDKIGSTNTGPYTKARQRLPKETIQELVQISGESASQKTQAGWKVYGREVKAFDGTTVKMADTQSNQEDFPQHKNQKKGGGFPIARLLIVVSLTVGTIVNYAIGAYKGKGTGEQSLLREVKDSIKKDDIVLGDRYFPSYFLMADLYAIGADGIFKGQSQRHYDFRKGQPLGKNDHVVQWKKPQRPQWMSQETYRQYPDEITVREFKVEGSVYVTTFLTVRHYHKHELAKIYKLRWHIEINLRSIKSTMNMDMLSCKSPEMVRKEIGIHFLAYNMIRIIIAEACQREGLNPREISFKGTVQLLNSFMPHFVNGSTKHNGRMYTRMLSLIIKNKIGNRPGRVEPRAIKQRQKPFKTLDKPRHIENIRLKKKIEKMIKKYAGA